MRRLIKRAAALLVTLSIATSALAGQQPAPTSSASLTEQAIAQLKQGQPQQALDLLQKQIAANPTDAAANLIAASCAIALYRPDLAVAFGERARVLEPTNWKIHTTLVTAYAMAGKTRERDAERDALRTAHSSGKIPDATQTSGFLLDRFKVKQYSVDAVEYFAPVGKFHIYYRFLLRDGAGHRVWNIDIQSDDFNQASWAKAFPQQAAEGQRQFQITGEGSGVRSDYRTFSGSANYDWIKAKVVDIINAQSAAFPGEPGA